MLYTILPKLKRLMFVFSMQKKGPEGFDASLYNDTTTNTDQSVISLADNIINGIIPSEIENSAFSIEVGTLLTSSIKFILSSYCPIIPSNIATIPYLNELVNGKFYPIDYIMVI